MDSQIDTKNDNRGNEQQASEKIIFGFWVYILTDCVLFASLFATYAVLHNNTYGGPGSSTLLNLPNALIETFILLTSSFTAGLATLAAQNNKKNLVLLSLFGSFLLGIAFLTLELSEFSHLIALGDGFTRSGFLSAFFTLIGTHGLHITGGLIWMAVISVQIIRKGLNPVTARKLTTWSLFWHFLDIIWIFIFSIVYLMGAL